MRATNMARYGNSITEEQQLLSDQSQNRKTNLHLEAINEEDDFDRDSNANVNSGSENVDSRRDDALNNVTYENVIHNKLQIDWMDFVRS